MARVRLVPEAEFAAQQHISPETARKRRRHGNCPSYVRPSGPNGPVLYPEDAINEWLAERTVRPVRPSAA